MFECGDGKKSVTGLCSERFCQDTIRRFAVDKPFLQPGSVECFEHLARDRVDAVVVGRW